MTGTPLDLLSLVGLGSRLLGVGGSEKADASGDFGKALEAAKDGGLETGRAVVSGPELGVDLSSDQLQRLSHAADMAEAQGAKTAAVLMDGMVIRLDVESRMALESAPAESALMSDVDAVLSAGPTSEPAPASDALLRRLAPAGSPELQN
ncbi:MAG: hypothetical protein NCW75_02020 [Phycisphaera sp.]|nr:MAG: hypothetical protein NCW75_02020 [Phycisphaera sp.]